MVRAIEKSVMRSMVRPIDKKIDTSSISWKKLRVKHVTMTFDGAPTTHPPCYSLPVRWPEWRGVKT
eukprot:7176973-Pyramimonas_sp.AAC.1